MKNARLLMICLLIVALIAGCNSGKSVYNITEYGAKGDGNTVNTSAINSTIKKCSENGGGMVSATSLRQPIRPGKFLLQAIKPGMRRILPLIIVYCLPDQPA